MSHDFSSIVTKLLRLYDKLIIKSFHNNMIQDSTFEATSHSVLIIDDEEAICELIDFKLSKEGYRVSWITNPLEAIGKARNFEPDIIILDVMMPELDGFRLCSMLRVDGMLKHVPILFLTAKNEVEDRIKGFNRGGDDYLTKPFDNRELVARIRAILSRSLRKQEALQGLSLIHI